MQVIKRDGRVMEFNKDRIVNAIIKAMNQTADGVDEELANKIASSIEKQLENTKEISVYEIQDLVEKKLMVSSRKEVATAYITYRYTRDVARKSKTKNIFLDILTSKSNPSIEKEDSYQNISDMMNSFAAEAIKPYVDMILLSKDVREAERLGYLNIVNKSYYATKAVKSVHVPLRNTKQLLKECDNVESAVIQIFSLVSRLKEEVIESISLYSMDTVLAPYVKKTYEEEWKKIIEDREMLKSEVSDTDEKEKALAKKRMEQRVHFSLKLLCDSFLARYGKSKLKAIYFDGEEQEECVLVRNTLREMNEEICQETMPNDSKEGGVVSRVELNLPQIASELCLNTKEMIDTPETMLIRAMKPFVETAIKSLVERFRFQSTATKSQFPVLMSGLWPESEKLQASDTIESVLRNGSFELKICGLEEAFQLLSIEVNDDNMKQFEKEINEDLIAFSEEYHLKFVLKNE